MISKSLAFYRTIKHDFKCEKYFSSLENANSKVALVRFRFGRNELGNNALSDKEKRCPVCTDSIEDESHFLLKCILYYELRNKYLDYYINYMESKGLSLTLLTYGKGYIKR